MNPRTTLAALSLSASLLILAGCGGAPDGPQRYTLAGTVTFEGKPVPAGEVVFEPDSSAGNQGPLTVALIENGKYRTAADQGSVGGKMLVTVRGFDGQDHPESRFGNPLFPPYETKVEVDAEHTTHDLDVPAAAKR